MSREKSHAPTLPFVPLSHVFLSRSPFSVFISFCSPVYASDLFSSHIFFLMCLALGHWRNSIRVLPVLATYYSECVKEGLSRLLRALPDS